MSKEQEVIDAMLERMADPTLGQETFEMFAERIKILKALGQGD